MVTHALVACAERDIVRARGARPILKRAGAYVVSEGFFWKVFESKRAKKVIFMNRVFRWLHRL